MPASYDGIPRMPCVAIKMGNRKPGRPFLNQHGRTVKTHSFEPRTLSLASAEYGKPLRYKVIRSWSYTAYTESRTRNTEDTENFRDFGLCKDTLLPSRFRPPPFSCYFDMIGLNNNPQGPGKPLRECDRMFTSNRARGARKVRPLIFVWRKKVQ